MAAAVLGMLGRVDREGVRRAAAEQSACGATSAASEARQRSPLPTLGSAARVRRKWHLFSLVRVRSIRASSWEISSKKKKQKTKNEKRREHAQKSPAAHSDVVEEWCDLDADRRLEWVQRRLGC